MKNWAGKITAFNCAVLLFGCASVDRALADRKAVLTQKQSSYKTPTESTTKYLALSGDKYDSFRDMVVSGRAGLSIGIPIRPDGSGAFTERDGARVIPVSFECDYQQGETQGQLTLSYKDPGNLYGRIYAVVEAKCIPLSPEERTAQIAAENEAAKLAEERRLAEEQAQAQREAGRKEEQRRLAEEEQTRKAAAAIENNNREIAEKQRIAQMAKAQEESIQRIKNAGKPFAAYTQGPRVFYLQNSKCTLEPGWKSGFAVANGAPYPSCWTFAKDNPNTIAMCFIYQGKVSSDCWFASKSLYMKLLK